MSLLSLIIAIAVVGFVLWAINKFVPMEGNVKTFLNIAVIVFLVIWLLQGTGMLASMDSIRVH